MTLRNLPAKYPSITINFDGAKKLDGRITFTRASYTSGGTPVNQPSAGTGTSGEKLQEFNINVPRLTDKGLLIEESRTNIFRPSIIPETSSLSWTVDGADLTANSGLAPDGSNTATLYDHSASTGNSRFYTFTGGTVQDEAYSFFIKDGGGAGVFKFQFVSGFGTGGASGVCQFDFSTNTLGGAFPTNNPEKIQASPLANGWFRITATNNVTVTGVTSGVLQFGSSTSTGKTLVWGFQREEATKFSTSYIPTTTATVTRADDLVEITGTNFSSWYSQSEGSFSFIAPTLKKSFANKRVVSTTSSSPTEGVQFWNSSGSQARYRIYKGGSTEVDISAGTYEGAKWGWVYKTNDAALFKDGALLKRDTSCAMPTAATSLSIGTDGVKHISSLTYYPTRLSDDALRGLTQ